MIANWYGLLGQRSMITGSGLLHFKQRKQIFFFFLVFMCEIYKKNLNQKLGTIGLLINTLCQEGNSNYTLRYTQIIELLHR